MSDQLTTDEHCEVGDVTGVVFVGVVLVVAIAFSVEIRAPNLVGTLGTLSVGRKGLGLLGPDGPTPKGNASGDEN